MKISGEKLAEARERRGITQEDLGKRLGGIIKQNISLWENGKKDIPPKYYNGLLAIFGRSICDLDDAEESLDILRRSPETLRESLTEALNEYANEHEDDNGYYSIDGAALVNAIRDVANMACRPITPDGKRFSLVFAGEDFHVTNEEKNGIRTELDQIWPKLVMSDQAKVLGLAAELLEKSGRRACNGDLDEDCAKRA